MIGQTYYCNSDRIKCSGCGSSSYITIIMK